MPLGNDYLTRARSEKNDEFYTRYEDIESEVSKFRERFDGKVVYCPTDGSKSNFTRYFNDHFNDLNLKALYCSDIHEGIVWFRDRDYGDLVEWSHENVDITSDRYLHWLGKCDIVVTNPPFSLFIPFLDTLVSENKEYLIIGQQNSISCKNVFQHIIDGESYLDYGYKGIAGYFYTPEHYVNVATAGEKMDGMIRVSGVIWYTSFNIDNTRPLLQLKQHYYREDGTPDNAKYPFFDNFRQISGVDEDCINVSKIKDIPCDYYGYMGVPITIMGKYNPRQFEIIQLDHYGPLGNLDNIANGKQSYRRVYVKLKRDCAVPGNID
jgi:hypothetical protein